MLETKSGVHRRKFPLSFFPYALLLFLSIVNLSIFCQELETIQCSIMVWVRRSRRSNEPAWIYGIHNRHQIHHRSATFITFSFQVLQQVPCPWTHVTTSISYILLSTCKLCTNKTWDAIFYILAPKIPPDCYRIQLILQQVGYLYAQPLNFRYN